MSRFSEILQDGDLRSIGRANDVVTMVNSQEEFDELFLELKNCDRKIVMRTADAIEKITFHHSDFLKNHKIELLDLLQTSKHIELKWHLALLITRIELDEKEFELAWNILTKWAKDRKESRIVRVNSIQSLFDLLKHKPELQNDFHLLLTSVEKENISSLNARIRKIKL